MLYCVKLVDRSVKRRKVVKGRRSIRGEKLREHQYMERYAISLESKRIEWDECTNIEIMQGQVKRILVDSARKVCISVRVDGKNPMNVG